MGDDSEWIKLPTDDKCVHKAWKARVAGYEEATKLFQTSTDPKNPEFSKYLGLIKKFVTDSNAIAQEKALDAVLAFVENAHVAGKTTSEVCNGVITKCLNSPRAKTKEKGIEIIMLYIEAEKHDIVQEELLKGLANKQPKVVMGCALVLREALRDFGSKTIALKPLVKQIQRLLEDRDKGVRDEGKQLVIEIYRWIGAALKPQLANLKPVQVTELEAEFENIPPHKPQQTRFLRSQQDLKAKLEAQAAAAENAGDEGVDGGEEVEALPDVDPYDLMDPVEILSKLPKNFFEQVEAKKWQDRKEVLEAVQRLAESPKIEPADYHDLVRVLKKVVAKDTNVMLVVIAAKCISGLAKGLRKKFGTLAPACIDVLLEKFREKKVTVVAALRDATDAVFLTTTLDPISETCVEMLGHKTPSVKAETAAFLARCFQRCTTATLPKKLLVAFIHPLLKTVNDTVPDVREASFVALGTALKVVGEKPMAPFLADIDSLKLAKIRENCDKAELIGKGGKPKATGGAASSAAAASGTSAAAAPAKAKAVVKPKAKASDSAGGAAPKSAAGSRPKSSASKGAKKGKANDKGVKKEIIENLLSDETVEEKAADLLPADTMSGLANANWKLRLSSIENLTSLVKGMTKEEVPAQICVRVIAKKPGLKENNFQVMKLKVDLVAHIAKNSVFSKTSASIVLNDLVDKIGDVKNGPAVQEALSCMAEATSLEYISLQVIEYAFEQKNPKTQSESLNWLSNAVKAFGLKLTVKPLIEAVKKALAATNPAVRTAAISLLGTMYMFMGQTLRILFESEKPALVQIIEAEFSKVEGQKPPTPTRGVVAAAPGDPDAEEDAEEEAQPEAFNVADLVPRTDISELIKPSIIDEMSDKNWKVRNEALQKVVAVLNDAKFITPNIGPLAEAIKLRLGDSNKILVSATLAICQTLATAMGPQIRQHVHVVGPAIVNKNTMGDSKPAVRAAASATLSAWVEQGGVKEFIEAEIFLEALKLENPNLRQEMLSWLTQKLPDMKKMPPEFSQCVPCMYSCLEDRSGDVRKKAQEAVLPFMIHVGYEGMVRLAGKLKPASKDIVMGFLDKAKPDLPQKPVKAPKAVAAKAVKGQAKPAAARPASAAASLPADLDDDDLEDEEEARPATAPSKTAAPGKGKAKPGAKKAAPTAASRKKDQGDEDTSPFLKVSNGKDQRFKEEKSLKILKWNFTAPRPEFSEQLKGQMEATFNRTLLDHLFHADFKRHIKAIEILSACLTDLPEATISNCDLILKWMTLRFFDTNTSVLLKALDYIQGLFATLATQNYHVQDLEAVAFVPYLVNKVGDPKDNIRKGIRNIFKLICKVYPASKMFNYLIEGLKSKNSKQRTECLEELGILVELYGINVCQPSPAQALKLIAQQISDRDNSVRSAALNTVVVAYAILGDSVYKYLGQMKDKDMGYLEERIKRSSRTNAPTSYQHPDEVNRNSPEEKPPPPRPQAVNPAKNTTSGAPSGLPPPRQVKKMFALDAEFLEEAVQSDETLKLVEPDIDDFINQPVKLPHTRSRPPSPSMKLLQSSDAKSALDLVISQIASNDIATSIQALVQIEAVLKDEAKSEVMAVHVDQFLVVCCLQMRLACTKHMASPDENDKTAVVKLYQCILGALLSLFQCKLLAKCPSRDALKDLFHNLITVLLDQRLNHVPNGVQVVRSVNVMVVRVVEKADQSNVLGALIALLVESMNSETCLPKFLDLIMKCMWKIMRMIPESHAEFRIDTILMDIHRFLEAFPTSSWKSRPNDLPLRTIKTILHSLAKIKGAKILNHLGGLENKHTELEAYLRKVLKNGMESGGDGGVVQRREGSAASATSASKRLSKTTHDMLAEIFKKIGSKENTREGLNDLYEFKQKFPEADLDPFLKKSSPYFQNYIERGLKNIEMERDSKIKQASSVPNMSNSSSSNSISSLASAGANENEGNTHYYLERLKVLRARCGLDNSELNSLVGPDSGAGAGGLGCPPPAGMALPLGAASAGAPGRGGMSNGSSSSSSVGDTPTDQSKAPPSGPGALDLQSMAVDSANNAVNLADLKQRLDRIKKGTAN